MVRHLTVGLGIATLLILNSPAIGEPDRTEVYAINLLRGIQTAEELHFANHGYYDTLQCLASPACVGTPRVSSPAYQGLIAADVAALKDYRAYTLQFYAGPRSSAPPTSSLATPLNDYAMVLMPKAGSQPLRPSLCGDRTGIYVTPGTRIPRVRDGRCQDTSRSLEWALME